MLVNEKMGRQLGIPKLPGRSVCFCLQIDTYKGQYLVPAWIHRLGLNQSLPL